MATEQTNAPAKKAGSAAESRGRRRTLIGRVASAKMQKTVVVEVVRSVRHAVYGKYVRVRQKYKAHDEKGQFKAGDLVEIRESRPLSREKRWTVIRLLERPVET
jgi:small subunit ribosomal protein S17